jgi:hypothetical protein
MIICVQPNRMEHAATAQKYELHHHLHISHNDCNTIIHINSDSDHHYVNYACRLSEWNLRQVHKCMAVVAQDTQLFAKSILENITCEFLHIHLHAYAYAYMYVMRTRTCVHVYMCKCEYGDCGLQNDTQIQTSYVKFIFSKNNTC